MPDDYFVERGWRFPASVDPPEETWYSYPIGDNRIEDQKWEGHVDMAHQFADDSVEFESELMDAGFDPDGIQYAFARAAVVIDGERFEALQGADETTNQVRDPEYVLAVAESRALKRAVKKGLNIIPADEDTAAADPSEPTDTKPQTPQESMEAVDIDPSSQSVNVGDGGEW
jgi:hypothetical protein